VTLHAADDATGAATALVNATTNIGIAGGAPLGSRRLGTLAVPDPGWVGAALAAASLVAYGAWSRGRPQRNPASAARG